MIAKVTEQTLPILCEDVGFFTFENIAEIHFPAADGLSKAMYSATSEALSMAKGDPINFLVHQADEHLATLPPPIHHYS